MLLKAPVTRVLLGLPALLLVATGCGSNSDDGDADSDAAEEQEGGGDADDPGPESPAEGVTLSIAFPETVDTLDPSNASGIAMEELAMNVFDRLVEPLPDVSGLQPGLATEWSVSDDGTTWTFELREGAVFHDGTPVNADAVVFSLEWLLRTEEPSRSVGRFRSITGVEAVDDLTVEVSTDEPVGLIPELLALPWASIFSPTSFEELGEDWHFMPAGSGPYRVVEGQPDNVVVEAFEDYWRGPATGATRLEYVASPEASTRIALLETGEAQVAMNVTPDEVERLNEAPGLEVRKVETLETRQIYFNHEEPVLQDIRVRQALAHALDIPTIIDTVMSGYATYHGGLVNAQIPESIGNFYDYDPELSRQLLEEAGHGDGLEINIYGSGGSATSAQAFLLAAQAQWAAVGIDVEVEILDSGTFADRYNVEPEVAAGDKYLVELGPGGNPPHPHIQLYDRFHTEFWTPVGRNAGYYSNPRVDELLDQGLAETDREAIGPIYQEIQEILRDEVAAIPLYDSTMLHGVQSDIASTFITPPFQTNLFHQFWRE